MKTNLERAAGGADEVAEDGDVGAVDTDAAGIDRQAELFGLFEIDTCVVEFGKAETLRGQNAIEARRIDGTGRTMPFPRTPRYLVELLPVAFVPGLHSLLLVYHFSLAPLAPLAWPLQPHAFTLRR